MCTQRDSVSLEGFGGKPVRLPDQGVLLLASKIIITHCQFGGSSSSYNDGLEGWPSGRWRPIVNRVFGATRIGGSNPPP
jgi:hypothetical protein